MAIKLSKLLTDEKTGKIKTGVFVAVGLIGIALIFLSGLDLGGQETASAECSAKLGECEEYRCEKEKSLCTILSQISGCGKVEVMISVEGSSEYVYLNKTESKNESSGGSIKSEPLIAGSSPVLSKVVSPRITGVLIVAQGAGDPVLDEKLISAAAAALGISTANICVAKRAS